MVKKLLCCLGVLFLLVGCSSHELENSNTNENTVSKDELIGNGIYYGPITVNELTVKSYNEIGVAIEKDDAASIAAAVARSFACDFFTFKGKGSGNNVGGTTYFVEEKRDSATEFLKFYYYKNYDALVNTYGEDNLPEVNAVSNADPVATTFTENDFGELEAYEIRLNISYSETTIPAAALKTETVITVAKYPKAWYVVEIK